MNKFYIVFKDYELLLNKDIVSSVEYYDECIKISTKDITYNFNCSKEIASEIMQNIFDKTKDTIIKSDDEAKKDNFKFPEVPIIETNEIDENKKIFPRVLKGN